MPRLIEIQRARGLPSRLLINVGDVLMVSATGAILGERTHIVEMLGSYVSGVFADDHRILSPAGPPNIVLLRALQPGQVVIEIITGDPWHSSQRIKVELIVEA